jgi:MFS family permease
MNTLPKLNKSAPVRPKSAGKMSALLSSCLGGFFDGFDASIYVLVLFPALSELLNTQSHAVVGPIGATVLAVFMVGWALGAIFFGALSDRFGRVRIMTFTILLYAIASGMCALSHTWQEMAICRFLVGLGIGGEMGAGAIFLSEYFDGAGRYRALGFMNASICAGYMFSAVANYVLGNWGWRYVFLCGLAPALLAIYIRLRLVDREPRLEKQPTLEPIRIILSVHLKKTLIILAIASTAIVNWWAVLSWVPAWVNQLVGGLAVTERSIVSFAMYSGSITGAIFALRLVPPLGRRRAFALAFAGSLLFDLLMFACVKQYGPLLIVLSYFAGLFAAIPFLYMYTIVPELFPARIRGTAFGISIQTGRTFAALAALLGGQIIAACHGLYPLAGGCIATVNLIGFAVAWLIPEHENYLTLESSWTADPLASEKSPAS